MLIKGIKISSDYPVICIPIMEKEENQVIDTIEKYIKSKAKMIEWRIDQADFINDPEAIKRVFERIKSICTKTVLIATVRTIDEGGSFDDGDEIKYAELLELIAGSKVCDIIDVEYMKLRRMPGIFQTIRKNNSKVLISYHNFSETPDSKKAFDMLSDMQHTGADIVKLACMPHSEDDCLRIMSVTSDFRDKYPDTPIIAISMGNIGILSRIAGEIYGSCITFASGDRASAPGQIPYNDMKKFLSMIHKYYSGEFNSILEFMNGPEKNKIYLTGYMATGKSTIGKIISRKTGIKLIEMDEKIVKKIKMPISEYFNKYGEDSFRKIETEILREIANGEPAIVSCGGGVPISTENRELMKSTGLCVVLVAKPEAIFNRVYGRTDRPLLKEINNPGDIRRLMEKRYDAYKKVGDIFVSTEYNSPGKTAELIIENIRKKQS